MMESNNLDKIRDLLLEENLNGIHGVCSKENKSKSSKEVFRQKCAKIILQLFGIIDKKKREEKDEEEEERDETLTNEIKDYLIKHNLLILPSATSAATSTNTSTNTTTTWERPISIKDLAIPICSPSLTTIVPESTLPKYQRNNYLSKHVIGNKDYSDSIDGTNNYDIAEGDDVLVEIFKNDLLPQTEEEEEEENIRSTTTSTAQQKHVQKEMIHSSSISQRFGRPSQRPLAGNLSSKLVEYTRGAVGNRRPFKPGGLSDDDDNGNENNDKEKSNEGNNVFKNIQQKQHDNNLLYCSPNERKNALDIILGRKSIIDAWKDGTLLTAPPGVDFDVGLSIHDDNVRGALAAVAQQVDKKDDDDGGGTYGDNIDVSAIGEKGCGTTTSCTTTANTLIDDSRNVQDVNDLEMMKSMSTVNTNNSTTQPSAAAISKMWDTSYFEEDSLFGDSSSDEEDEDDESSSDSGNESEKQEEQHTKNTNNNSATTNINNTEGEQQVNQNENIENNNSSNSNGDEDINDIDEFLSELEHSTTTSKIDLAMNKNNHNKHQKKTIKFLNQNLSVSAMKQRKCWAVTTSLNLENFQSIVPQPAITYPFELDGFQKQAVARIERGECIFVAAHTSAGKTVCAEYAIALARKHCTRAIYTSPIKALSNQKYRDFKDTFGDDVGLITGDLQINADSSCLIMTTEILRSMLYRGADLIRDIEWVIFDEVHYINDTERGVVWEEVIIMLPDYVNMIFLSATTPNTIEFSDWIGRTKRKLVHVIRTDYRPVPLSHHLYAGLKLHKIMEGNSGFINKGYSQASKALLPASEREKNQQNAKKKGPMGGSKQTIAPSYRKSSGSAQYAWQQSGNRQNWTSLVKFLEREGLMPTVVFSFSKKKCEEIANMLSTLDLNTATERNTAHAFSIQTMARLSPKDAALPQVLATCEMVKRGIGVHHGGLLPILKEMVEILFSKNLIKVLFATETFAMGVNMPARAVVFNSIRKHDGTKFRVLEPGEYTQMAGRAGRRGLDKVGTVIMCCFGDEPPPQLVLRQMLTGSSTKLQSQFRLTYNMIMNLLRVEDMTVEGMIKRSFSEFATQRALTANEYPKLLKRGMKALSKLDQSFERNAECRSGDTEDIQEYFRASSLILRQNQEALTYLIGCAGASGGGSLVAGRVIFITAARKKGFVKAPAIIVKPPVISANATDVSNAHLICMVLCPKSFVKPVETDNKMKEGTLNFIGESKNRYYVIKRIEMNEILIITNLKHKVDATKLYSESSSSGKNSFGAFGGTKPLTVRRVDDFDTFSGMKVIGKKGAKGFGSSTGDQDQLIDQVMKVLKDAEEKECELSPIDFHECTKNARQGEDAFQFSSLVKQIVDNTTILRSHQSHYSQSLLTNFIIVERKETLRRDVKTLQHLLSNESLELFPDFLQRKALLRTLNYIDKNDIVCVKGRVACEVNTCEEIIVTELIFEGILNELEPREIVALLSALIFQEKTTESELDSELPERLRNACERMKTIAMNLGQLQNDHGIQLIAKDYCDSSLKFGLVHVVYEWASGVPFKSICELTMVQEGSIVRTITRLDELCREVRNCSRIVGNPVLYRKMEEASSSIKRDIVFASSLYI